MSIQDLARAAGISAEDEELLALLLAEEGVELAASDTTCPGTPFWSFSPNPGSFPVGSTTIQATASDRCGPRLRERPTLTTAHLCTI